MYCSLTAPLQTLAVRSAPPTYQHIYVYTTLSFHEKATLYI